MDLDEYRQHSLDNWDRFARNWAEEREFLNRGTGAVAQAMVTGARCRVAGATVLEIAAGTGEAGFALSERLGGDCRWSRPTSRPAMVEASRGRAEELGLEQLRVPRPRRRVDGPRGRLLRRRSLPLRLHADGRPAAAMARDAQGAPRRRSRSRSRSGARRSKNLWAAIPGMTLAGLGHLPPPEPGRSGNLRPRRPGPDPRARHRRRFRRAADRAGPGRMGLHRCRGALGADAEACRADRGRRRAPRTGGA